MDKMDRQSIEELNTGEHGYWDDSEEDQVVAALCATEPVDLPRVDPVYALMSKFTEDLFLLSNKLKNFGRPE